jgi:hypothetical protein
MEILTGIKAGKKLHKGYEPGTVFALVAKKIHELYVKSKPARPANQPPTIKKKKKK